MVGHDRTGHRLWLSVYHACASQNRIVYRRGLGRGTLVDNESSWEEDSTVAPNKATLASSQAFIGARPRCEGWEQRALAWPSTAWLAPKQSSHIARQGEPEARHHMRVIGSQDVLRGQPRI